MIDGSCCFSLLDLASTMDASEARNFLLHGLQIYSKCLLIATTGLLITLLSLSATPDLFRNYRSTADSA